MKITIMGCGRVGARLAVHLTEQGHNIIIIDKQQAAFRRLDPSIPIQLVTGTGIDMDVQRSAGIEQADVFIACTSGDNTNIMAAQIAREVFQVRKVIIRINDPIRNDIFREMGYETVCPTTTGAQIVVSALLDGNPTRN